MNRSELVKKLELVGQALAANDLVQVYKCFCFDGKTVSAYNDDLGIVTPCNMPSAFGINGSTALGLIKHSHTEEVEFSLGDANEVMIKAGKSRFKMPYFKQEDFLFEVPKTKAEMLISIDAEFVEGLRQCLITTSRDDSARAFMCICFRQGPKYMSFYSTDGDAITRYTTKIKNSDAEPLLLPLVFCEALIKTVEELGIETTHTLVISKEWAHATIGEYSIYGRMLENPKQLDYEKEMKNTMRGELTFTPVPKGLQHALDRARVVADPESAKTAVTVKDGKLYLSTETHMGIVKDTLLYKADAVEAQVSSSLVHRAIKTYDQIAVAENCTAYKSGAGLFLVIGNMG